MARDYQQDIFTLLQQHGRKDSRVIAKYFGVSRQFIERHLNHMLERNEVESVVLYRPRVMKCRGFVVRKQKFTAWQLKKNNVLNEVLRKKWV